MADQEKTHFMAKAMGYGMGRETIRASYTGYDPTVDIPKPVPTTGLVETNLVTAPVTENSSEGEGDDVSGVDENDSVGENEGDQSEQGD